MAYESSLLRLVFVIAVLSRYPMIAGSIPTVYPAKPFNANADAAMLSTGLRDASELKQSIDNILTKRVQRQRLDIVEAYKNNHNGDLLAELVEKTDGYYRRIVQALLTPLLNYNAMQLNNAVEKPQEIQPEDIIEILCTQSDSGVRETLDAYQDQFNKSFIMESSRSHYMNDIIFMCVLNRDEDQSFDEEQISYDVDKFLAMADEQRGLRLFKYTNLVGFNNHRQLRQFIRTYENVTGRDFEVTMKEDLSDDSFEQYIIRRIVRAINSKFEFLAERLHASIEENVHTFIRLVVSRSEIDLGDIKQAFLNRYQLRLENYISEDDFFGDYTIPLLSLISIPELL